MTRAGAAALLLVACGGRDLPEIAEVSAVSPDGAPSGSPGSAGRTRGVNTGRALGHFRLECSPDDIAPGPNGGLVVACSESVRGYARDGTPLWHAKLSDDIYGPDIALGTTPDGATLAGIGTEVFQPDASGVSWRASFDVEMGDSYKWGIFGVGATSTGSVVAGLNDEYSAVVAAFDGGGKPLWSIDLYSSDGGLIRGRELVTRADGSVLIAGFDEKGFSSWRRFIALIDPAGTLVWALRGEDHPEGRDHLYDAAFTLDGGVLAVGAHLVNGTSHGVASAYDASGRPTWEIEGRPETFYSVLIDDDGAAIVGGEALVGLSSSGDETFRVKPTGIELPSTGHVAWGALGELWTWGYDEPGHAVAVRLAY